MTFSNYIYSIKLILHKGAFNILAEFAYKWISLVAVISQWDFLSQLQKTQQENSTVFQITLPFHETYGILLALFYSIFIFYLEMQMPVHQYDIFVLSQESYSKDSNMLKIDFSFESKNSSWKWINRMVSVDICRQQDVGTNSICVKIEMYSFIWSTLQSTLISAPCGIRFSKALKLLVPME